MIEYKQGDILDESVDALVNTVNCVGFMGRGIALQFKRAWPENFRAYAAACRREEVVPGQMFVWPTGLLDGPRFIINFPTKRHWRSKSRMEDIESGLAALVGEVRSRGIRSIAIPPLGSGLGGLDWEDVKPRIEQSVRQLDEVRVVIFEPRPGRADVTVRPSKKVPNMTPGRAALIGLMERYLAGLLDPFVTLIEVHKLMYFMQEAGENLRLSFKQAHYGPYAEKLRHVLRDIEGHYVSGYGDGGDAPDKRLELLEGAIEKAHAVLDQQCSTKDRFQRVAHLVEGFESPFGLELLATVHWLIAKRGIRGTSQLVESTHAWGPRKERFSERQILLARQTLIDQGWASIDESS
ncbi:MAG: macro domain-containing protein [Planctomycetota bacterium]